MHIKNTDGSKSIYHHQDATEREGEIVSAGQTIVIGDGGGKITAQHLHYEYIPNNETNPAEPLETQLKDVYENK